MEQTDETMNSKQALREAQKILDGRAQVTDRRKMKRNPKNPIKPCIISRIGFMGIPIVKADGDTFEEAFEKLRKMTPEQLSSL